MPNCRHLKSIGEAESTVFHFLVRLDVIFFLHLAVVCTGRAISSAIQLHTTKPFFEAGFLRALRVSPSDISPLRGTHGAKLRRPLFALEEDVRRNILE